MKMYAVGYLSLFDGALKIEFIEAECERDAAIEYLGITESDIRLSLPTMEEVSEYVYDSDCFIEVKEVPN